VSESSVVKARHDATSTQSGELSVAYRVLIVCTANQLRSPMTEFMLRRRATELTLPIEVASAGIKARDGQPMPPRARAELTRRGIAVTPDWTSQKLTPQAIADADLILAATGHHRATVVRTDPYAIPRTFLLLQFARIARQTPPPTTATIADSGSALVSAVNAARNLVQPPPPGADDLHDPAGHSARSIRQCAEQIERAIDDLLRPLVTSLGLHGSGAR